MTTARTHTPAPHRLSRRRVAGILVSLATAAAMTSPLGAQAPLGGQAGWQLAPSYAIWHFDCCTDATDAASIKWASQWTIPIVAAIPEGRNVTIDIASGWMTSDVALRTSATPTLHLSGPTDTKVRAAVRFGGDALLATFGLNIPTGATNLDAEELNVQRVVGAPQLRFDAPALGTGLGGTAGLVYTRQIGSWSWGLGTSYEYRGEYTPAQAIALGLGTGIVGLRPGQAVRISIGTDGLVGQSAMSVSLASTIYTKDRISTTGGATPLDPITLGPMFTGEWRLRTTAPLFRELSFYAFDRYRTAYRRGGAAVTGTSGNEAEVGAQGLIPVSPSFAFVAGLRGRHFTGLSIDNTLGTAGATLGGGNVGVQWRVGGVALQPAIGAEFGRIDTGVQTVNAHELYGSFTITSH
ncbi:MAG TPA: hypothetical protein VF722_11805 [Gemmatimonadaceae bacterium]